MKKILISIILFLIVGVITVSALTDNFKIDTGVFSFSKSSKTQNVLENFDQEYTLSSTISTTNSELEEEITLLSKKVTYLLLGEPNKKDESSEEYHKRHQDYLSLRYAPTIPKGDGYFGYDENSQEYQDDLISGFVVPGMFNLLNELDITYNSFGNIRVSKSGDRVFSSVTLLNVRMKEENADEPMKYDIIETNITLYYTFKELNGKYMIYHIIGEYGDDIGDYFAEVDNNETKGTMQMAPIYESSLQDIYSYAKLNAITDDKIEKIYNDNKNNIVILNSYYNNCVTASANGFFINDGLLVTSWSFLEKSLVSSQRISVTDELGNPLELDGIVTINPETDVAVLKLKNKSGSYVTLANSKNLNIEDPVMTITSKTGIGLTIQKGIVISNDGYIQSAIPLVESDSGSPLINEDGLVVGLNTSKQLNSSASLAVGSAVLKEIQDKFKDIKFEDINTISFETLKEDYYYVKYNDEEIKNNIPKNKWNTYKKIGNIEKTIDLELVKANYSDGIISLRYKNSIPDYIDTMQLSSAFREELKQEKFKEVLKSNQKYIYENNKYKVIIMDEFDYLIVVMVKL